MVIKFVGGKNMNKKYTSYALLGVLATFVLLLSSSPTLAGTFSITSNPSGATVTISGNNLGVTPYSIDSTKYPSPTSVILSKSGYQSANVPIYNWMTYLPTVNLKPLSGTTSAPAPTPTPTQAPALAPAPAPTPAPSGWTFIDSVPQGAKVYVYAGELNGKYLGTTPFYYDVSTIGANYIQFVKTGYKFSLGFVYPGMPAITCILNT